MDLPASISTGRVVGQFVVGVIDGADSNDEPDLIPARGTIAFTPSIPYLQVPVASPNPFTVLETTKIGVLDALGYLCTPDPSNPSKPGARGVRLISTDNKDASVKDWTWIATPQFEDVNGTVLRNVIKPTPFHLPGNETRDLTNVVKVPASQGIGTDQALALAEAAQQAAQSAASNVEGALAAAKSAQASARAAAADLLELGTNTAEAVRREVATEGTPASVAIDVAATQVAKAAIAPLSAEVSLLDLLLKASHSFVVTDPRFGVKGDGITNDTPALQKFFDFVRTQGGGTVIFPPGTSYHLQTNVKVCSNINVIALGATFVKLGLYQYSYFAGVHEYPNTSGYGAGPSNVKWTGGTFRGNYEIGLGTCAFALHHSQNWEVDGVSFIESQASGHTFDLAGCNQIVIKRCLWKGFLVTSPNAANAECIQIDVSGKGSPSAADEGNYDNQYTHNVTIEDCQFLPLDLGGVHHPCPNPLGSHAAHEGRRASNIRFVRNLVVDLAEDVVGEVRGGIHFVGCNNVTIRDNVFRQSRHARSRAIAFYGKGHGRPANWNPNSSDPSAPLQNPLEVANVTISDNVFEGFYGDSENDSDTIFVQGLEAKYAKNIQVTGNSFINSSNIPAGARGSCVKIERAEKVVASNNTFENVNTAVYPSVCRDVTVSGNTATSTLGSAFYNNVITNLTVENNKVSGAGSQSVFVTGSANVVVGNNTLSDARRAEAGNGDHIRLRDTTLFMVSGNILRTTQTVGNESGVNIYGASGQGVVSANMTKGFTAVVSTAAASGGSIKVPDSNQLLPA